MAHGLPPGFFQVGIRFDIDHANDKRESTPDAVDDLFRLIAQMAAPARMCP